LSMPETLRNLSVIVPFVLRVSAYAGEVAPVPSSNTTAADAPARLRPAAPVVATTRRRARPRRPARRANRPAGAASASSSRRTASSSWASKACRLRGSSSFISDFLLGYVAGEPPQCPGHVQAGSGRADFKPRGHLFVRKLFDDPQLERVALVWREQL